MSSPRSSRAIPAACIAAVLLVTGPLLWGGGVDLPDDALYYGVASWEWLAQAAHTGTPPWWVSGKLGGVSLFSDVVPQGPFYPFAWLGLALPVLPAMGLAAVLHALGTLFAVRWLARLHGVRRELAWLAGAGVAAGPLAVWAAVDFQVDAWPTFLWFPVVLGCLRCSAEAVAVRDVRAWRTWVALGGAATAWMLLGSHLRVGIAAGAALALWALVRGRDLRGAVATGALGLLGGAPAYAPMLLEARSQSVGGMPGLASSPDLALGLWNAAGWLAPKAMLYDRDLGVGAVLGAGALLALLARESSWRRLALFAGLLVLAGTRIPLARQVMAPLTLLTHPVNLVYPALAMIPLAVLGARGLELLDGRLRDRQRRWLGGAVAALLGLAGLRLALGAWTFPSSYGQALYGLAVFQALLVLGLGWRLVRRGGSTQALVLLAVADLALFGVRAHLAVPSQPLRATSDLRGDRQRLSQGFLDVEDLARGFEAPVDPGDGGESGDEPRAVRRAEREQAHEEEVVAYEVEAPRVQARLLDRQVPVHGAMALQVPGLAGRSKVMPRRAAALLGAVAGDLADVQGVSGPDADVLRHLFSEGGRGWRLLEVFGVQSAIWNETTLALRRQSDGPCRLLTRTVVEPDEDRRVAALLDRAGAQAPALLEAPLPHEPSTSPVQMLCDSDGASIVQSVQVPPGKRALVAVRRPLHPGWVVRDGERVLSPVAVDQVHQAVLLDAGPHRLVWTFEPPGLRASLASSAAGWLLILLLGIAGRRRAPSLTGAPARALLALALLSIAAPSPALAASGELLGAEAGVTYEVLLTSSLDLTRADAIAGRAALTVEQPRFQMADLPGDSWAFLRQSIPREDGPPLVFYRPADLLPLQPGESVLLRAVPRDLALQRASGEPASGWWGPPTILTLLVFIGLPLLRRRLLKGVPGASVRSEQASPLPASPSPPAAPSERWGLAAVLLAAVALRLPGMGASLDLLEWSYGPGTTRVVPAGEEPSALAALWEGLVHPACLELVHPPLWHWLQQGLWALGQAEWLMRLPSLLLSVATCVLLWRLLRGFGPRVALGAAAAYAIAPPAVHFGRDATPYALLGFACVGSLILLLRALRRGTLGAWAAWLGLLVLSFLSHYGAVFFAGAQVAALLWLAATTSPRRPWALAAAQACGAAPLVLLPALAWSALHFAHFAATALDTRLYADTYPLDPGPVRFFGEFGSVALGIPPTLGWAALPALVLVALGLRRLLAEQRALGVLASATAIGFVVGCGFFYANLVGELGGHVFWGFRWVSWFVPVGLGVAAVGVQRPLHLVLAAVWMAGVLLAPWRPAAQSTRPDYRAAAAHIAESFEDRDGLAALPLWGQRGPARTYITQTLTGSFGTVHDTAAWSFDGRAGYLEMIDERFPFETSARNGHVDRLWLLVPDERMFGREKFRAAIAQRALRWAHQEMDHLETQSFSHLTVSLFARRPLVRPERLDPRELATLPFLEPNAPPCEDDDIWLLLLRGGPPGAAVPVDGVLRPMIEGTEHGVFAARLEGGSCDEAPPTLRFGR